MRPRLFALTLALCLGLCACASPAGVADGSDGPTAPISADPSPSAAPSETPDPEPSQALPETGEPPSPSAGTPAPASTAPELIVDPTAPSAQPTPEPSVEPTPAPTPEPSAEPEAEPAPDARTAGEVYSLWNLSSDQAAAPGASYVDMSAYLDAYYSLDPDDMESFAFYQPGMSGDLQEVFVAKAKDGKAETVKAACQDRLEALREEARFYTGTGSYVDAARLESAGDWVVLAVCPEADRLVKIVRDTAQ